LFVLFLVLFWRRSRGCTALWLSSLKATRCGFPLKNFRHPALAHYVLSVLHRSCHCSASFVRPVPKTPDTHIIFLDAVVPLCAAQLHVTLEPWCTTTIILNHIGLTRRTGS
jgi:hypothetical protein